MRAARARLAARRAFTIIEMMAAMTLVGLLMGFAIPKLSTSIDQARVARAIGDLRAIAIDLTSASALPTSLADIGRGTMVDPWGRPYVYRKFPGGTASAPPSDARQDRFGVPINSGFDLYSVGKDGGSSVGLTGGASQDDIVVANDGGFIGLGKKY